MCISKNKTYLLIHIPPLRMILRNWVQGGKLIPTEVLLDGYKDSSEHITIIDDKLAVSK